jgi:hypothetical protein
MIQRFGLLKVLGGQSFGQSRLRSIRDTDLTDQLPGYKWSASP